MAEPAPWSVLLAQICGLLAVLRARCRVNSPLFHLYSCLYYNAWYALTEAQPGSWQYLLVWSMVACACWCDARLGIPEDERSMCDFSTCVAGANMHFLVFWLTRSHMEAVFLAYACVVPFVHVLAVTTDSPVERQMWALFESCIVQNYFYALRHPSAPQ